MIKGIIFDYDGVIAESVNIKTNAFAKIYQNYGDEVIEKVVSHHLLNGGISRFEKFKIYHKDFLGLDLDNDQLNSLSSKFSKLVIQDIVDAPFVPGAVDFIVNNYNDYDLFISTGTPQNEIIEILKRTNMRKYFKSIHGSPDQKTIHINKIIQNNHYEHKEIIFIGDADADISAAKAYSLQIIFREHTDARCKVEYKKMTKVNDLKGLKGIIDSF